MTKLKHLYRKFFWSELKDCGCCSIFLVIFMVLIFAWVVVHSLQDDAKTTDTNEIIEKIDSLESY